MKLHIFRNCLGAIQRRGFRARLETRILRKVRKQFSRTTVRGAHYAVSTLKDGRLVLRSIAVFLILTILLPVSTALIDTVYSDVSVIEPKSQVTTEAAIIEQALPVEMQLPVVGSLTTRYSRWHSGIDLAAPYGTPLKSIGDGVVARTAYEFFGKGHAVEIDHGDGLISEYGHLSKIEVKPGDTVAKDTIIGRIGSTGFSTGPHLHLEISDRGKTVDPLKLLPKG